MRPQLHCVVPEPAVQHTRLPGTPPTLDPKFVNDPSGKLYYAEWVEGLTKTHKGGLSKYERRLPQRVFAVDSDRCPLQFLRLLLLK